MQNPEQIETPERTTKRSPEKVGIKKPTEPNKALIITLILVATVPMITMFIIFSVKVKQTIDKTTPQLTWENLTCTDESRQAEACAEIYQPVCATVEVQCITAPCDPITTTYSNTCEACKNLWVSSYKQGQCK